MQQISSQYLVWFKNYNYMNLNVDIFFLSEQETELRLWCKNNSKYTRWICQWIIMYGAQCWIATWDNAKANQHCWAEDCFIDDMEWFAIGVNYW